MIRLNSAAMLTIVWALAQAPASAQAPANTQAPAKSEALASSAAPADAQAPPAAQSDDPKDVRVALLKRLPPGSKLEDLHPSPIPGIYEFSQGTDVSYITVNIASPSGTDYAFNELTFGAAAGTSAPEPSSLALVLCGAGLFPRFLRKRRQG